MVQQGEKRLLNEWLAEMHRRHLTMRNVRLGKAINQEEARMYSVMLRYADAVVVDNDTIYIIEAKLAPNAGAVGQLLQYGMLILETPEFSQYRDRKIQLLLLSAKQSGDVAEMCARNGIRFVYYPRDWLL